MDGPLCSLTDVEEMVASENWHFEDLRGRLTARLFFFVVLGFELRTYTLSHSTSPFM
jgi:hypothetical protein